MKKKVRYICSSCQNYFDQWFGRCPNCKEWSSFIEIEEEIKDEKKKHRTFINEDNKKSKIVKIDEIDIQKESRIKTKIEELDRVLGNGIMPSSYILIGGEPGIGKSTILMQLAGNLSKQNLKVLYISAEESLNQIKQRALRLDVHYENIYILCETSVDKISKRVEELKPNILIIDSIQTVYKESILSACGSITQIKESGAHIMYLAKGMNIPTFLVGHITKDGEIAGPKLLEHMVDTVLYFEGDKNNIYRILRSYKNRFGSTNEIGIFQMTSKGLEEILNPSEIFINKNKKNHIGTSYSVVNEGTRSIIIEVESLVNRSFFPNPKRMTNGFDKNKLSMLIAVLEKKLKLKLFEKDIFINVAGGIKIVDQSADLSCLASIYSSYKNVNLPNDTIFIGEVGLTGDIRGVYLLENRLKEIKKLGFKRVVISSENKNIPTIKDLFVKKVENVNEFFSYLNEIKI